MYISFFENVQQPAAIAQESMTVSQFRESFDGFAHVEVAEKTKAACFSMAKFGNKGRKKVNIEMLTGIVLDIDEDHGSEQWETAFRTLEQWAHVRYTTYSHTAESPRWRIIVPLKNAMTVEEFEESRCVARLAALLGLTVDRVSMNATQLYFLPSCPPGAKGMQVVVGSSSKLIDIASLPTKAAATRRTSLKDDGACKQSEYLAANNACEQYLAGVAPIFVGGKFYVYVKGIWVEMDSENEFAHLLVEKTRLKVELAEIRNWIGTMRVLNWKNSFPDAANGRITLKNGVLDLATQSLVQHDPLNYHRSGFAFDYDSAAVCPKWLRFLDDVFMLDDDKREKIAFLQELVGYLLVPTTKRQLMFWFSGSGSNGKSVITKVIRGLLGDTNVSSLSLSALNARFMTAELVGKLANICDEMKSDMVISDDILKQVVSGERITAERKGKDPFSFVPTARIVAAANDLPRVKDVTHGFFRRIRILTFTRTFTEKEAVRELEQDLMQELPGIFNWAVAGLLRLEAQDGFTEVPSSDEALVAYREESDPVMAFMAACLQRTDLGRLGKNETQPAKIQALKVYAAFQQYCAINGFGRMSSATLGKRLKNLGVQSARVNGLRYYKVRLVNLSANGISPDFDSSTERTVTFASEFEEAA